MGVSLGLAHDEQPVEQLQLLVLAEYAAVDQPLVLRTSPSPRVDEHRAYRPLGSLYSNISTVRATSPAFIARKASFTSSRRPRRVIISSRRSRPRW